MKPMQMIEEFLLELRNQDIQLWLEGEQLHYSAPEGKLTPTLLAQLRERKAEVISFLYTAKQSVYSQQSQIKPIERNDNPPPLSYAQQRLWFLEKMALSRNAYNIPLTLHLLGQLDYVALQTSLNQIIARHETLRTSFSEVNGTPVQAINSPFELELPKKDLTQLTPSEQTTQLQQLLQQENEQTFNLEVDLPIRAQLYQLGTTEHVLQITLHHIAGDGWSLTVLPKELSAIYTATLEDKPFPLPELPIQYADFAVWQRNYLQGETLETQLSYWKQKLQDLPQLQLPIDYPRSPVQTFNGASIPIKIPATLTSKVKQLTQKQGTSLFMTLLAAFKILLYRYSGQESIVVGSPIANRNRSEIEGLIGFFVNSLVMYTDLRGEPSFIEVLNRVKQTALEAYSHQDIPFEKLVEELQPERSLSQNPLFQVMFAVQQEENLKQSFSLPNLKVELAWEKWMGELMTVRMDIEFNLWPVGEEIKGFCAYNQDLFEAETISRMLSHYQNLLSAAVETPEEPVSQLPLMTEPELDQILVAWNNTKTDYPNDKCIHQLFEEQVEKTPDAIAVVFEEQKLTYSQLNSKANQLAHYLQKLGVVPETLVGICVERSVEMVVGLLAILKAGGAYVPLDPNYPTSRLNYMIEDAELSILLTQEKWQDHLSDTKASVICLDTDEEIISQQSQEMPENQVTANQLAYVIYTSGSTGKPKGVTIPHQGLLNLVFWHQRTFEVKSSDRASQIAGVGFDASVWEIWPYLSAGACLHLVNSETRLSPEALKNWLVSEKITISFVPTPILENLCALEWPAETELRTVLTGGDKLHKYPSAGLPFCVFNNYGPTENTVVTTSGLVVSGQGGSISPPIGKPISNTKVYILDKNLQPVPIGVVGELHVGGDGLAIGYHNRPELTAEKFIPNPFDKSKLYNTGDLARYLADGNIEFLGRIDHQVKVRGYRIETGEIEAVINSHPQVKETVVLAIEYNPGNKRLVGYIVAETQTAVGKQLIPELREYLKSRLPEYMVPSGLMVLSQLPLTPNGKVDRKALPVPDVASSVSTEYIAPETETQKVLAEIWKEVLGIEKVGIHDNFFEVGGDSIISIQIVARAQKAGIQLTTKQLFQNQTIAEQAAVVGEMASIQHQQGLVTGEIPLTPIQHWFFEQNLQQMHHFNQSLLLSVSSQIKPDLLSKVVEKILEHHDALRLRYQKKSNSWQQINSGKSESIPFQVVDLSKFSETEQITLLEQTATEQQASLNLSDGPIMRVVLFNLGSQIEGRLLIIIHHLAVDGVSWRILLEDLFEAYNQLSRGETIKLPEKTTAFQDWAVHLVEYGQSQKLQSELDYWLNQPWSGIVSLPIDYLEGKANNTVGNAVNVTQTLSQEETTALLQEVPSAYNTQINDVLLTALVQSLGEWMGTETVLIDLEGHGREELFTDVDLSRTVGWFTSMFPVQLQLSSEDIGEALKSVKEQLRKIPERGIGYGILLYLNQDEQIRTQLAGLPKAEVGFNYLGQFNSSQSQQVSWQGAWESSGANQSSQINRAHLLDINALTVESQLQITWTFNSRTHNPLTIESVAEKYMNALQNLIAHCQSPDAQGFTPSDFPAVDLTQEELDDLMAEIN
ncbi:amino acid adenylation domain-containing protein [Moorena producens]|uniref:amino acid adenylation domain-containing protein n=1 Tax=Moorena producens TaxID=1155739 RepID=UPI003C754292